MGEVKLDSKENHTERELLPTSLVPLLVSSFPLLPVIYKLVRSRPMQFESIFVPSVSARTAQGKNRR